MGNPDEKYFLVSASQLLTVVRAALNWMAHADTAAVWQRAEEDCRKIEVPDWATHFAKQFPGCIKMEEIKR